MLIIQRYCHLHQQEEVVGMEHAHTVQGRGSEILTAHEGTTVLPETQLTNYCPWEQYGTSAAFGPKLLSALFEPLGRFLCKNKHEMTIFHGMPRLPIPQTRIWFLTPFVSCKQNPSRQDAPNHYCQQQQKLSLMAMNITEHQKKFSRCRRCFQGQEL